MNAKLETLHTQHTLQDIMTILFEAMEPSTELSELIQSLSKTVESGQKLIHDLQGDVKVQTR